MVLTYAHCVSHQKTTSKTACVDLPVRGGLADLESHLEGAAISGVFIALPGRMSAAIPRLLMRLERYPLDVRVVRLPRQD